MAETQDKTIDDEELDQVTGGSGGNRTTEEMCPVCGVITTCIKISASGRKCTVCGNMF